jgi:hypothetical protein
MSTILLTALDRCNQLQGELPAMHDENKKEKPITIGRTGQPLRWSDFQLPVHVEGFNLKQLFPTEQPSDNANTKLKHIVTFTTSTSRL